MKPKLFGIQIWWYVPDFPIDIRIRLAELKFFFIKTEQANVNRKVWYWADDKQSKARNSDSKYRQMALVGFDT